MNSGRESPISWCVFDLENKSKEIKTLEERAAASSFWDDPNRAKLDMRRLTGLVEEVGEWRDLDGRARTIEELADLALEEKDESLVGTLTADVTEITENLNNLEFELTFSDEHDVRNAIVAIHAGAGGVESQDWVSMILRMYVRWAEKRGFGTDVLDMSPGEEAGIKSTVLQISGDYAYGYMKSERGVHRLVRMSPFDADHARHTSFSLVEALPEAEEGVDVEVDLADVKVEVFRAGGAGGQSVQKNSTAVRLTHMPTGIKVSCQNERSQHQNKVIAMRILMARLADQERQLRAEEVARLKGEHVSPEWGNQIRSYVLQPYKMVKDHRTNFQTSNAEAVLDGELDEFMGAYLTSTLGDVQSNKTDPKS